jgi:hypothetical protein
MPPSVARPPLSTNRTATAIQNATCLTVLRSLCQLKSMKASFVIYIAERLEGGAHGRSR